MNFELLFTNVGFAVGSLLCLGYALAVFIKAPRNHLSVSFLILSTLVAIFELSHLIGINIRDPELSRQVFMFNLCNIFIVSSNAHFIFALIGKLKEQWLNLIIVYIAGAVLLVLYLIEPYSFLLVSEPKMYFPNYYVAGEWYWMMRLYFVIVATWFSYHIIKEFISSHDPVIKNRLKYVTAGLAWGYCLGSTAVPLVFDYSFDPILSILLSLYVIPFAYATLRYELLDIRIVAKRALVYAGIVVGLTSLVSLISLSNELIIGIQSDFPRWIMPALSSLLAVPIGSFVWRKLRENDLLKYEFINIITHKFRTPLTRIRWASESLTGVVPDDHATELKAIRESSRDLVSLTSALVSVADMEHGSTSGTAVRFIPGKVMLQVLGELSSHAQERQISLVVDRKDNDAIVVYDSERIKFVFQTLIENAISYTPTGGIVTIHTTTDKKNFLCSVKDSGIGIAKSDLPYIFTKFYRSSHARSLDTEGMGIGLYLVKAILERFGGSIKVYSEGTGKGTEFSITIPRVLS
jgi:signal transduction histidine kinase